MCSADVELGAEIELHGIEDFADLDDAEEELYFSHSDHLGSASFITNASGEAVQHLQYLPFGESFVTQTSSSWESRYTFSGKEKDQETGYSYFGARYYDSDLSVWLSVVPIAIGTLASKYPSMSPFMYTAGNPVMLVDPDGREIIKTRTRYKTMKDGSERKLNRISLRKADRIEINITIKDMKVIDLVGNVNKSKLKSYAEKIQAEIIDYWNTSNRSDSDENGYITNRKGQKLKVTTVFENDISVANNIDEINRKDIVVANVDWEIVEKNSVKNAGMTLFGGRGSNIILTQTGEVPNGDGRYAHEFGHVLGLDDIRIYRQGIENRRIMYNWTPTIGGGRAPRQTPASIQSMPSYNEFKRSFQGLMSYHLLKGI